MLSEYKVYDIRKGLFASEDVVEAMSPGQAAANLGYTNLKRNTADVSGRIIGGDIVVTDIYNHRRYVYFGDKESEQA